MSDVEERMLRAEEQLRETQETMRSLIQINTQLISKISNLSDKMNSVLPAARRIRSDSAEEPTTQAAEKRLRKMEKQLGALIIACSPIIRKKNSERMKL